MSLPQRSLLGTAAALLASMACGAPDPGIESLHGVPIDRNGAPPAAAASGAPQNTAAPASASDAAAPTISDASAPVDAAAISAACTEPGAVQAPGKCYFALTTAVAWQAASDACVAAGAHLVNIMTADEQASVSAVSPNTGRWIGLEQVPGTAPTDANAWSWGAAGGVATFTSWATGEPNGGGCGRLREDGMWTDRPCTDPFLPVCERP